MNTQNMTTLYKNIPWMYSLLHEEATGAYYLQVVCGTSAWYEMALRLTEAEVALFLADLAAHDPEKHMTLLAKQVMGQASTGIAGREYLR
ncbi:hypothetical protein LRS06_03080 [Hymenobacter sp. J193]|uniref:hypothetical protein n=1 Tax=Hymenobacter sp. J193 TaxID=2898429 RepID=UPI002150DC51|nr:hypothetical protein [Hymenobacter sp. J193]MCR5886772.1 hypothetical protein [Hymenobacter sp. J193]